MVLFLLFFKKGSIILRSFLDKYDDRAEHKTADM